MTERKRKLDLGVEGRHPGLLPTMIIGGAPKAGTSSLFRWVSDHPCAVGSFEKETYYFADPGTHMYSPSCHVQNGLDEYRQFFVPGEGQQVDAVVEATPSYLYSETALRWLPDLPTHPKFIFLLREPSAQLYSVYNYFRNNWDWIPHKMSFAEFVEFARGERQDFKGNELARYALRYANYAPYLRKWRAKLGDRRMRIWLFEELRRDQRALAFRAAKFAGLDPSFYDNYEFPRENLTYEIVSPLVQRFNLNIRGHLPKGKVYDALRALYRGVNTRKCNSPSPEDQSLLVQLQEEFRPKNEALAAEFGLDLRLWTAN